MFGSYFWPRFLIQILSDLVLSTLLCKYVCGEGPYKLTKMAVLAGFLVRLRLGQTWFGGADPRKDQGGHQALRSGD